MFASDQYELLDFGGGRKLERFGPHLLDRPSPAADGAVPRVPELWTRPAARFDRNANRRGWSSPRSTDDAWHVHFDELALEVKLTASGHVGVFPEQAANWRWLADQVRRAGAIKVLNLFAYTGAGTLAAAAAGAEVVHVDASTAAVAWARRNAAASGLGHLPVRWIVEDVLKFCRRERMRGNWYDAVVLDPPAYGHGPGGETWKLQDDLAELLPLCFELCRGQPRFLLLTSHSGRLGRADELLRYTAEHEPRDAAEGTIAGGELFLDSSAGGRLHCGACVRWSR